MQVARFSPRWWRGTLVPLLLLGVPATALAEEGIIEEVVVTGSLVKRETVYDGRAPIQTVDATLIETSGAMQSVDILKNLTVNTGSELASEQSARQGTTQFSLRGLGVSSSLTLLNGRRAGLAPVPSAAGTNFFDINTLPVTMIERIEILRDGASATYGSEAVAGVANIITRKGFEGFEIEAGYRDASNESYDLGFAMGSAFDRGRFNIYGSYFRAPEANLRREFGWFDERAYDPNGDGNPADGSFTSARGSPGSYRRAEVNPDGTVTRTGAAFAIDVDCVAAGGVPRGPLCRNDFADSRAIVPEEERWQFFAEADYDISDQFTLITEIGYSSNEIKDLVGAQTFGQSNVSNGGIWVPANHPFNFWTDPDDDGVLTYVDPADWDPVADEAVDLAIAAYRPLGAEVNNQSGADETVTTFNNFRVMTGFDWSLTDRWSMNGYFSQANSEMTRERARDWSATPLFNTIIAGSWNPFGTRTVNPTLVTPKTVEDDNLNPANVGAVAASSDDILALFNATGISRSKIEQTVIEAVVTGDLFELDSGPISGAFGAQYRDLSLRDRPDSLLSSNQGLVETISDAEGNDISQDVWAVFGEVIFPIADFGEFQVAVRHEDYGDQGSTTDPKLAAQIRATDWLSFRGSWGTSFQAAGVNQLAGSTGTGRVNDPFTAAGFCVVNPDGSLEYFQTNTVGTPTSGENADLNPQDSENFNIGVMLTFGDNFDLSLDYWNYDYQDVIAQAETHQAIVDNDCRDDGVPDDPRIVRSGGQISSVTAQFTNIGRVETDGFDLNAVYVLDAGPGALTFNAIGTLITSFDVSVDGDTFVDQLGSRNHLNSFAANPELRFNFGVTWASGNHLANATVRYIDSYLNDEVAPVEFDPPKIDDWTTLDLYYSYTFANFANAGGDLGVSIGVNNVTDEDPPGLPTGNPDAPYNLRPGYDGLVHDVRGRMTYVRLNYLL